VSKWADWVITAVRFNGAGTHIEEVRAYEHTGSQLINQTTKRRLAVVSELKAGTSYCTATQGRDGRYYFGASVAVVRIDGEDFIKTRPDGTKRDNLDNLPTF
jgi:hypothetical protein